MEDFNKYKIFYEVAKEGNITKAAENLYISQPAISQTIKKLEDELGVKLFVRNKQGVELTMLGKEVFDRIEGAILSLKSIDKMIEEQNELKSGKIVIGAGSNIAREILSHPISEFLKEFPNIEIVQFEEPQQEMLKLLKAGKVDILVSQENVHENEISFCPLKNHNYVFVKSKKGRGDRFITITKGSYMNKLFYEAMKNNGLEKNFEVTVSGYLMAIELAKLGVGVTLVPKFIVQNYLDSGELIEVMKDIKLPSITFGYYYNKFLVSPATRVFIKFLEDN